MKGVIKIDNSFNAVLCKICKTQKYVDDFIGGHLFMSTYKNIQNMEGATEMSEDQEDFVDGAEFYCKNTNDKIWVNSTDQNGNFYFKCIDRDPEHKPSIEFAVRHRKEDEYKNIFCLYSLLQNKLKQTIISPNPKLEKTFGEYCVVINDPNEFLRRIFKASEKLLLKSRAVFGFITYVNDEDKPAIMLNPFEKLKRFIYQNEARFVLDINGQKSNLQYFEVGDLSDIVQLVSTKDLVYNARLINGNLYIGDKFICNGGK
ncbi:MAG: hypothetical protein GX663_01165 [Clostridiales bacterium]|nr:hypothetical protein [Clostridiales bacterium]